MTAVDQNCSEIADFLMDNYSGLDFFAKDTLIGDTALHTACRHRNLDIAKKLFAIKPEKCLTTNFKGHTPIFVATQVQDMELLALFDNYKYQALSMKDYLGENPLFECARNGNEKIFEHFTGDNEFYKARGIQNHKGQTIEHMVCLHKQSDLVDEIRPRLDTRDYYGCLPLYYSLQQDDTKMIAKFFTERPKECFGLRNYKWETIFHIAAKANSVESLKLIIGNATFIDQLLKKDYKGNTAMHIAAKHGHIEILTFLCQNATKGFLEIQNDFGYTVIEAAKEK
jgi:ankyrin repeat protein